EDLVKAVTVLRVAVTDEESKLMLLAELHEEISCLLSDPGVVRVRRAGEVLDPPGCQGDKEQHLDPLQERRPDGEEVAGEHACRLRPQERPPRGLSSFRRRRKPGLQQRLPN